MAKPYIPYDGPIVTRKDARAAGLARYYTGKPCKWGHLSERDIQGGCLLCIKLRSDAWYAANKARHLESGRAWRSDNPERAKAIARASETKNIERRREQHKNWRSMNKDRQDALARIWVADNALRVKENLKRWHEKNKETRNQSAREQYLADPNAHAARAKLWRASNPEKVLAFSRTRRARVNGADGWHTGDEIVELLARQRGRCAYCQVGIKRRYHADHIIPLKLGGSNWISNIQLLCQSCNLSKGAKHPIDFMRSRGRLL